MSKTVLYFTPLRWQAHEINTLVMHYGDVIVIREKRMRPDLGNGDDYFEITYQYVG